MKKFFKILWNDLKIILGLALIACTFYFGYNYLNSKFRTPDVNYGDSFHNLPENSMDVIVLGSSHAQYSFVPSFFYQDTGLYSYMLGSSFQPLNVSYQMLKEALKTQKPELVILEVFSATYQIDNSNGDYDYRYVIAEYQMTGDEKYNTIDYISTKEKALSYKNEFINNHNNWRDIDDINSLFEENTDIDTTFGFVSNWEVYLPADNYWFSFKSDEDVEADLEVEDMEALNNIYNLCKENDIELLLYMTPMDSIGEYEQSLRHKVWDWANDNNIPYIDMLENDEQYDIRSAIHHDGFHAFINGASYITDLLANYTKENYSFSNHKNNEELEELYKNIIPYLSVGVLWKEANASKYLTRLKDYPGTLLISYRDLNINDELRQYIDDIGLSELKEGEKFYGVINNGELLASSNESIECEVNGHKIRIDDTGIYFDDEFLVNDDSLTFVAYNRTYSEYAIKRVRYLNGVLWDKEYDSEYRYSDQ